MGCQELQFAVRQMQMGQARVKALQAKLDAKDAQALVEVAFLSESRARLADMLTNFHVRRR